MHPYKKSFLLGLIIALLLSPLGTTSCTDSTKGSNNGLSSSSSPAASEANKSLPESDSNRSVAESDSSLADMLADVSQDVGQVSTQETSGKPRICVLEERHTSIPGQFEIALMLLRLHERYGLRDIALEGLTKDKQFPSLTWFRNMGGPGDEEIRNQVAVGLLQAGEISAVELIAMAFPDVVVHAADDPVAYRVELTKKGSIAGAAYLYKIGIKSVRPEHYSRIQQLNQQKKVKELLEYVISLDPWAEDKYEQLNKDDASSIEDTRHILDEIENRAASVGAEISADDRSSMSEAKAFFDAAGTRTHTLIETTLAAGRTAPLIAMNVGAAHTPEIVRLLHDANVTFGVLKPLSLAGNSKAAELSYSAFDRKSKSLSVAFSGKGLGSLLDGRRKPPPATPQQHVKSATELRFAVAKLVKAAVAGGPNFPDPGLRKEIDGLDYVKVNWDTVQKKSNGDVSFTASVLGEKGWGNVSALAGMPEGIQSLVNRQGKTLEQLLKTRLDEVRKEPGEREEPKTAPVVEFVTPEISAAFAPDSKALENIRITG